MSIGIFTFPKIFHCAVRTAHCAHERSFPAAIAAVRLLSFLSLCADGCDRPSCGGEKRRSPFAGVLTESPRGPFRSLRLPARPGENRGVPLNGALPHADKGNALSAYGRSGFVATPLGMRSAETHVCPRFRLPAEYHSPKYFFSTRMISLISIGFAMCAFIPCSMQRFISSE